MNRTKDKYDVVIIGAGIGGLVCGCYLARSGLNVLIAEKNNRVGGCCVSFTRKGVRFDAGAHVFGSCEDGDVFNNLLKRLGVSQDFTKISQYENIFISGKKIFTGGDLNEYLTILQSSFKSESLSIVKFFDELMDISKHPRSAHERYRKVTYQELLDRHFRDNELKAILSIHAGYIGVPPERVSAVAMCTMLYSYLKNGAYYPSGGASKLSDKLADRFKFFGGELRLNMKVDSILIKSGRAYGVVVTDIQENNREIYADSIVSNIDASKTFFNLIGANLLSQNFKNRIKNFKETPSVSILYLGVDVSNDVVKEKTGWHYESCDINKGMTDCLYVTSPSLYDLSAAKNKTQAVQVFCLTAYPAVNELANYKLYKESLEQKMLERFFTIMPEAKDKLMIKDSATPVTIEKYTGNKNGSAYGWSLTLGQFEQNEAISEDLIPNIHLAGHWTNPGGGVSAVSISGYVVAKRIMIKNEK